LADFNPKLCMQTVNPARDPKQRLKQEKIRHLNAHSALSMRCSDHQHTLDQSEQRS
jgi:hypothetical protein